MGVARVIFAADSAWRLLHAALELLLLVVVLSGCCQAVLGVCCMELFFSPSLGVVRVECALTLCCLEEDTKNMRRRLVSSSLQGVQLCGQADTTPSCTQQVFHTTALQVI